GGEVGRLAERQEDPVPGRGDQAERHTRRHRRAGRRDHRREGRRRGRPPPALAAAAGAPHARLGRAALEPVLMDGLNDWLGANAHWAWLTLGLVLAGLEMLVPGVYLIWLAAAAIVTGVLTAAFALSLPMQVIDFVFLSLILAFSARRMLRERPIESADPLLNRRGARLVGETATGVQATEPGSGP